MGIPHVTVCVIDKCTCVRHNSNILSPIYSAWPAHSLPFCSQGKWAQAKLCIDPVWSGWEVCWWFGADACYEWWSQCEEPSATRLMWKGSGGDQKASWLETAGTVEEASCHLHPKFWEWGEALVCTRKLDQMVSTFVECEILCCVSIFLYIGKYVFFLHTISSFLFCFLLYDVVPGLFKG